MSPRNIIESSEPSLGAKAPRKERNATTLPLTWKANNQHRQYALEKGLDLADEVTRFKDHHQAKGSRFKDWDAALRLWLTNSARWTKPQRQEASHNGSWFPGA